VPFDPGSGQPARARTLRTWPALEIRSHTGIWDLIQAALTDFDVAAIDDNAPEAWRVFFHTSEARARAAVSLRGQFQDLSLAAVDVVDEDWAARSQAELTAVRVGNIIVAPPWDIGASSTAATTIVIQPSMGFGTGHHATTRLCLAHLQQLTLRNRTVVDIGTGSGVLAIAASRLGATHVLAIDDDPDAIQSARENIALNPDAEITLDAIDLRRPSLPRRSPGGGGRAFDVILANLTGGLLTTAAASILAFTAPGGSLILSGFMESEAQEVLDAFSSCTIGQRSQEEEWVCVTLLRSRS
jgi:ribosomal protein L11 methyltransferase